MDSTGQTEDLKIGIIGFGLRSGLWRHAHRPGEGSQVTIVCDISERGRADAAASLPDAQITDDFDEFLSSGIDAVLVLTPDYAHAQPTMAALRAGIAVFCEKPLAITIPDCDEVLQTAYETGTRLYVGHNMRHSPAITQMRELITTGRIGEVKAVWCRHFVGNGGDYYFKDWHADRSKSTGLLLQKAAHDIDVIHWLASGYSTRVAAMGRLALYGDITDRADRSGQRMKDWYSLDNWPPLTQKGLNPVVDVEDISMMIMQLDNDVMASYEQCHFTPDYWRNYTVIGTEGRIENLGDGPGDQIMLWNQRRAHYSAPDETFIVGGEDEGHGGADPVVIAEFLRFVAQGGATQTSPIAARQAVAAGCMATESLRGDSSALPIPPVPQDLINYFENGQQRP